MIRKYILFFVLGVICSCIIMGTSEGCTKVNVRQVEQLYPGCQVLKARQLDKDSIEVIIQCGPLPEVIRLTEGGV